MRWKQKIKVKHLFTEEEDYESVQASMNAVADVLSAYHFPKHIINNCRSLPEKYALAAANSIIDDMYDFADRAGIWIG